MCSLETEFTENMDFTHQIDSDSSNFMKFDENPSVFTQKKYSNRSIFWSRIKSLKQVKKIGRPIGYLKQKTENPNNSLKENEFPAKNIDKSSELPEKSLKRKALEEIDHQITKKPRIFHESPEISCCISDCANTDVKKIKVGNSLKWTELFLCENHQHLFKILDDFKAETPKTEEKYSQMTSEKLEETIDIEISSNSRYTIKPSYPISSSSTLFILPEMEKTWKDSKCFVACYVYSENDKMPPLRTMVEHVWLKNTQNTFSVKKLNVGQQFKRDPDNSEYAIESVDYSEKTPKIYVKRSN